MGLGDFLTGIDDSIDRLIGKVSPGYQAYLDRTAKPGESFYKNNDATSDDFGAIYAGLGDVPGFNELMNVLDAPRRGIDTALITAQHVGSEARKAGTEGDVSEFFNKSTWSRAWDMASMDNADRVTGGQILAGAFGGREEFDPMDAAEAAKLQADANGTWYGRTMATTIDLGTSFVSVPGTGVLARGRAASGINSIADAEKVAQRFNAADLPAVAKPGIAGKAKDTLHLMVPSGAQNVDSLVSRQLEGLRAFDGQLDEYKNFNALKARLEHAPDGEVAKLANLFTEINKVADPAVRERLRMNTFLSAVGSPTAKRALIEEAPLLAKNFEGLTTTPREAGAFTELYQMRLDGEDLPLNEVIDRVWNTSSDKAELAALKGEVKKRKTALADHNKLVSDLRAMKPKVQNTPEAQHVKAKREELNHEVRKLQGELKDARVGLHGTKRWAGAAAKDAKGVGATDDVVDFNQAIGEHRRRVEDVQARLAQAKADRDLLNQTPLHDPQLMDDWRSMVEEAKTERDVRRSVLEAGKADRAAAKEALDYKTAEIGALRPYLNHANTRINEILDIAGKDSDLALVGDAKPTALNALKSNLREQIGADHYVLTGDGNTIVRLRSLPGRTARMALHPQARGSIALNEVGLGARQLADTMARSKVFSPEEIGTMRSELIRTEGMDRVGIVERVQDQMLERMATRFYQDKFPGIAPEEAVAKAQEITGLAKKAWGKGNDWVAKAADEQIADDIVMVRDADGQVVAYDGPMLRSQLADNAPIFDPWDFERTLKNHEKTLAGRAHKVGAGVLHAHDFVVSVWKYGALLRPGLMVRSMLDTGPRALASMTAAEAMASSINGAANLVHNRALKGLAKARFAGLTPDQAAARARYLGLKPVKVGGKYEFRFAEDAHQLQTNLSASSKGQTIHGALFHDEITKYDGLSMDRASWKRRKADSELWHLAYKEYADMLLASPTARKLADLMAKNADEVDVATLREQIKDSPEFTAEYRKYAQPAGRTRSEFLQQLVHEVDLMFPNDKVLTAAKNSGLNRKMIDREFPVGARFDVPSPELSALEAGNHARVFKEAADKAFRVLLDKPDMWLARNPAAVNIYNRTVKNEYASMMQRYGKDYELSPKDIKAIDSRARNNAIGFVRETFFDTTRNTGLHRSMARFSPFIAAWEDAMMSWGRLIYDDPRRLTKLAAAYHSPYTVATSQQLNLVVDQDGKPIGRNSDSEGVFVNVPLGALGRKAGVQNYRIRLDAINSIAQGETWWLPGVGPSVALGATYALGSGKVISREAALDIIETDNPIGKAMLKSVFLGGEVPASDASSLAMSTVPGWMRTLTTQTLGTGKIRTRQTTFNYLVADALANGRQLRDSDYTELWDRADRSANAAAVVRLAMSAGFGMTGTASVDGQFYVDQLHIIYAMDEQQRGGLTPEEFFAKEYPEAADLDWSITKNKTGITASVNAAKSESRLQPMLRQPQNKLVGWMVLGKDNMVDTEFSRTAYAMQRSDGNRLYQSADDSALEAQAAVGERQARTWMQQVSDQMVASGADPESVETSEQYKAARRAVKQYLMQTNPAYAREQTKFDQNFDFYLSQARRLSTSGPLKDRSDMATFRDYDAARTEVLDAFGIKSLNQGTSEKYVKAKAVMWQVGQQLAAKDLGFQQMWDKFLEREVE